MSFGGGWGPPPWHSARPSNSWRPYENHQAPGPMRGLPISNNGTHEWNNTWMADPYFGRNTHVQNHMANYERNRMHMFQSPVAQRPLRNPILEQPNIPTQYAQRALAENANIPGLLIGKQRSGTGNQRKLSKNLARRNDKDNGHVLHVNVTVYSERIELRWNHPASTTRIKYVITCENLKTNQMTTTEITTKTRFCSLAVTAGKKYRVSLTCHDYQTGAQMANWSQQIRAVFSPSELLRLRDNCFKFIKRGLNGEPQMHEFCVVYRCKPKVYWDEIHHYGNDVMQKYIKDDNGQPGNLINGEINGLFFSARLLPDLSLPMCSPFGNVRMVVNAGVILDPNRHHFYFADFYCNKSIHYVTVVICRNGSETDKYCNERLIQLNPLSNPFVRLVPPRDCYDKWRYFINYTLWVELYFTEDLQLNMGQFSAIVATGAGSSKIGGLPNNKQCTLCNLYPTGRKKSEQTVAIVEDMPTSSVDVADSTLATILQENSDVDSDVADTICYLVDRVEEQNMTVEEFTAKIDVDLMLAVEKMNKAVAKAKTPAEMTLSGIAKNLTDFAASFGKRRDALIQEVKKLKIE